MPRNYVSATAPGLPEDPRLSRRSLLTGIPVSGAALAMAAPSFALEGEGGTEILRLFREHFDILKAADDYQCSSSVWPSDDELYRLFFNRADWLEDKIMSTPSTCAADFAAKLIVSSNCGELDDDWSKAAIWQEARALTGMGLNGYRSTRTGQP